MGDAGKEAMSIQVATIDDLPTDLATSANTTTFLNSLLKLAPGLEDLGLGAETIVLLKSLRDYAGVQLQELTFPTTRDEEWRFTDLSPLLKQTFQVASSQDLTPKDETDWALAEWTLPEAAQTRLVFVNGQYCPTLSDLSSLPQGVVVGSLDQIPQQSQVQTQLHQYLAKQPMGEDTFHALNTAGLRDVAIVWVPRNVAVVPPIHLLFLANNGESATFIQPRCLVVAESNSALTLVEEYRHLNEGAVYFTNSVTEVWVEDNAQVTHVRVQQENDAAFHIGKTSISQGRDARYACHAVSFGGRISRHNLEVLLTGEQTQTTLNGLTMIQQEQLADTHSTIAFMKPYGSSRQLHKCIVDDRARAVFNGKVFVPKAAQMTDASQLSRSLLLSPKARVDTKPQLEITADNVKCSHGATVSQLEADEVFYLQSRGLDQQMAQKLLVYAFAAEVLTQIPVASVCDRLAQFVREQTGQFPL